MTLHIIRHAQTDTNANGHRTGWSNPPLNDTGICQASELRPWFRQHPGLVIISSDLLRASQTAQLATGMVPTLTAALREQDWANETQDDLKKRILAFYHSIEGLEEVAVFTHGRTARLLEAIHTGTKLSQIRAYANGELRSFASSTLF